MVEHDSLTEYELIHEAILEDNIGVVLNYEPTLDMSILNRFSNSGFGARMDTMMCFAVEYKATKCIDHLRQFMGVEQALLVIIENDDASYINEVNVSALTNGEIDYFIEFCERNDEPTETQQTYHKMLIAEKDKRQ